MFCRFCAIVVRLRSRYYRELCNEFEFANYIYVGAKTLVAVRTAEPESDFLSLLATECMSLTVSDILPYITLHYLTWPK